MSSYFLLCQNFVDKNLWGESQKSDFFSSLAAEKKKLFLKLDNKNLWPGN